MKIVYNNIIPFKGFIGINLFGVAFVRNDKKDKFTETSLNHEKIHTAQMKEFLYVFFYIVFFFEWLIRMLFHIEPGYSGVSFEKEAKDHENDFDYLKSRRHFAQWRKTPSES